MPIIKFILLLLILNNSIYSKSLVWSNKYHQIRQQAKLENKHILLFICNKVNPSCEYMEIDVFNNKYVAKKLSKRFLLVKLDTREDNIPVGIDVLSVPSIFFVDYKGRSIYPRITGEVTHKQVLKFIDKIR